MNLFKMNNEEGNRKTSSEEAKAGIRSKDRNGATVEQDYIQYKKLKGDPSKIMQSTLPFLLQRCQEMDGRASPDLSVRA